MRPTRRFLGVLGVAVGFVALALALSRPWLLLGAGVLTAWVITEQLRFVAALAALADGTTLTQTLSRGHVAEDAPVEFVVSGDVPDVGVSAATLGLRPPAGATGVRDASLSLLDDLPASETASFTVAGRHTFDAPVVDATSASGLFTESFSVGDPVSVRVEPRSPREVHVGAGGERIAAAYGEHPGQLGQRSAETSDLRAYQPGDPVNRIDWKATARLGSPFVREFEPRTERRTVVVVDHRAAMDVGEDGETALDYAREVALSVVGHAASNDDPLGLTTVGDGGVTRTIDPGVSDAHYDRVRARLADLEPTAVDPTSGTPHRRGGLEAAHRNARRLRGGDSAFARTLSPYFERAETYVDRLAEDPLYRAVEATLGREQGTPWVVVVTGDAGRPEVREAAKLARRRERSVSVFLAPRVLFETHGLLDLDDAYERYVDFEEFRRDLDRVERVRAYEFAPGDRIDALLAARHPRSTQ